MLFVKATAYLLTHSSAVFSDLLESVIHLGAIGMALYSVVVSLRPPDESHPYGHGKIEFFSAGIEGTLIALAAVGIIIEATGGLINGRELERLNLGAALTLFAAIVSLVLGLFLVRCGRQTSSIALVANGKHILTDSYTSFGVVFGLVLVLVTGVTALDPIVAIVIAVNILYSGYKLVRTSVGGLMDEADRTTLARIADIVGTERRPEWISMHHLRVMRTGDLHHLDFHLTVPFYWSVREGHRYQQQVCDQLARAFGNKASVMIHLDPCTTDYCRMCEVDPCHERKHPCSEQPSWDLAVLTGKPPLFDPDES